MSKFFAVAAAVSGLVSSVAAHGYISSPTPRLPGAQMEAVCGETIYNNQKADHAGPVQLLMQQASTITDASECNLWLCKGYQYADNTDNVQTYSLGQEIPMKVTIVAPHSGYANVSIVNAKTNTVIGSELKYWASYASTATGVTANDTDFSVTIPEDLDGCTEKGECLLQWYWYAPPSTDQTYESCVDFVIGDGSSSSNSTSAATTSAAAQSSAAATSAAATTSAAAAATTSAAAASAAASTSAAVEAATTSTSSFVNVATSSAAAASSAASSAAASSVAAPSTIAAATSSAAATTSAAAAAPTTLATSTKAAATSAAAPTTAAAAAASSAAAGSASSPEAINQCLDEVNSCIAKAQGDDSAMSACADKRTSCYSS